MMLLLKIQLKVHKKNDMVYRWNHLCICGLFRFFTGLTAVIDKLKTGCGKIK